MRIRAEGERQRIRFCSNLKGAISAFLPGQPAGRAGNATGRSLRVARQGFAMSKHRAVWQLHAGVRSRI